MAKPSPLKWLPLWTRALDPNVEIGIAFRITGVRRESFRDTLYKARTAANDPALETLIMFLPAAPYADEIWICKKAVELDASP